MENRPLGFVSLADWNRVVDYVNERRTFWMNESAGSGLGVERSNT